jgi:hypothetical protein
LQERRYQACDTCGLVFMAPEHRLGPEAERAHYGTHRNDPADPAYRAFLGRVAVPLVERLPAGATGLDFGCGPGPALAVMLAEQGFPTALYDPFFAPDPGVLERTYQFVTCTETAEHFHSPALEFERLDRLLAPGAWLAVMTGLLRDDCAFERWHYARDPTHVCFYRSRTMQWIAGRFGWLLTSPGGDVVLFRKPPPPHAA